MLTGRIIIHDEVVRAKLAAAGPNILARNRAMASVMLEEIKSVVYGATPTGPGHFGYHGRDTLKIEIGMKGLRTSGKLKAAVQLYWREFGTRGRFRGRKRSLALRHAQRIYGMAGAGGERAFMVAHKALTGVRRFIKLYYGGGMASWWRL